MGGKLSLLSCATFCRRQLVISLFQQRWQFQASWRNQCCLIGLGIQQPDPSGKYAITGNKCFNFGTATVADLPPALLIILTVLALIY